MFIFCNNQFLPQDAPCITADDRGFCLGDGIFETILSYNKNIPFFPEHWQRLCNCAKILNINLSNNYNKEYIYSILQDLLIKNYPNNLSNIYIGFKIILTRGAAPRSIELISSYNYNHNIIISTFETNNPKYLTKTLSLASYKINQHSILPQIKSLNYLDKILAKQQALQKNFDDCLFLNLDNNITEASTSNIFFVLNCKTVITPKIADGVLPGVTRGYVINTLKDKQITIVEDSINFDSLINQLQPKSAFLTNSVQGISLVNKIDDFAMSFDPECNQVPELLFENFLKIFKQ